MGTALATSFDEITPGASGSAGLPAAIFDEFAVPVWAVALQVLDDEAHADDVVEATFTTFARSPGSLSEADDPGLALLAAARRLSLERLSRLDADRPRDAPPAAVSGERWRSALALGRLSELELAVAHLRHGFGLRREAIGFQLGRAPDVIARSLERVDLIVGDQVHADSGLFEALRPPDPVLRHRLVENRPASVGLVDVDVTAEWPAGWNSQHRPGPPLAIAVGDDPTAPHPVGYRPPVDLVPDDVLRGWDPPPDPDMPPVDAPPVVELTALAGIRRTVSTFWSKVGPGLVLAAMGAMSALMLRRFVPGVSPLVLAVLVGVAVGNLGIATDQTAAGLAFAAKRLLRVGVVLLGLRLSVGDIFSLGVPALVLVGVTVAVTFFGVQWLGARLGLSPSLSLLVATGYSICGASAIAAVEGSTDADEEEVAAAIGLVTVAGSLAIFTIPLIAGVVGLDEAAAGAWVGASIHDVAQVVAAGSAIGTTALATAVVVKLTRIVLLAPVVAGLNAKRSRTSEASDESKRPPILPAFVIGFLAMMLVRTFGLLPPSAVEAARSVEGLLFTVAMVGLGANVRLAKLRTLGARPLLLGGLAWALIAATSFVGVSLVY